MLVAIPLTSLALRCFAAGSSGGAGFYIIEGVQSAATSPGDTRVAAMLELPLSHSLVATFISNTLDIFL